MLFAFVSQGGSREFQKNDAGVPTAVQCHLPLHPALPANLGHGAAGRPHSSHDVNLDGYRVQVHTVLTERPCKLLRMSLHILRCSADAVFQGLLRASRQDLRGMFVRRGASSPGKPLAMSGRPSFQASAHPAAEPLHDTDSLARYPMDDYC